MTLGGRRMPVERPRGRACDGAGELPVPAYELFSSTELLGRMAMEKMLAGLSTRRYPVGLEPVGTEVEHRARSTSKSAVSRRFVERTETALSELLAADLSGLELVALMIDGVHIAGHLCVVALGIAADGVKHPLTVVEGSTENTTLVWELLVGLRDRGLDTTRPSWPPAWSRPAASSAASTAICTWPNSLPNSSESPPEVSHPTVRMKKSKPLDQRRAAAEVPRTSGQPRQTSEQLTVDVPAPANNGSPVSKL